MRSTLAYLASGLIVSSAVADAPCSAPISRDDVRQISRVIRNVTSKPIVVILGVDEDRHLPGTINTGKSFMLDLKTGKRTPRYTHTDVVSVYMTYKDRSHVDVYEVRKVAGRWKIESKKDWFL